MRRFRVYVDTSVFGGVEDEEFSVPSRRFFDQVRQGRYLVLVSDVTLDELAEAPDGVRRVLQELPPDCVEDVSLNDEIQVLAEAYITAGVVGPKWMDDALHVATATVVGARLILSWNFRHIVNYDRIRAFNSVNLAQGYDQIDIRSPLEVGDVDPDENV